MPNKKQVPLYLKSLTNAEVAQFNMTTIRAIEKTQANFEDFPMILSCVSKIREALQLYEELLHQEKPVSSKELKEADKKRDIDYRNLSWQIIIAQSSRNVNKKAVADELFQLLNQFKGATKQNYEGQTAYIRTLLGRLEAKTFKDKINQIGAREVVDNLKNSQEEFYKLYLDYSKYQKKTKTASLRQQKDDLLKCYDQFYKLLSAMVNADETSPLKPILLAVNDVRRDYAERVKRRRKKNKKSEAETLLITHTITEKEIVL